MNNNLKRKGGKEQGTEKLSRKGAKVFEQIHLIVFLCELCGFA